MGGIVAQVNMIICSWHLVINGNVFACNGTGQISRNYRSLAYFFKDPACDVPFDFPCLGFLTFFLPLVPMKASLSKIINNF